MGRARGRGANSPSKRVQRESRIQEALAGVQGGKYKSYRAAAKAHQVSFQTLHDRATGRHQSIQSAARKRQLLSPSQEAALLDWCRLNSSFTTPLHARALRTRVFEICHRRPGRNWVPRFIRRHPCLVMAKPRGLDPKRAQNFIKDDFLTIAKALRLAVEKKDTIASPTNKIKTHLDEHPALADNARFSALFQIGGAKRRTHSRRAPLSNDSAPNINATSSSHSASSPAPHFGFGSLLPVSRPPAGLEHMYTPAPPLSLQYQSHSSANTMSHGSYTPPNHSFTAPSFVPYPSHLNSSYSPS